MRIAVTGATGFIGRYIVRRLIESGHTCRCWHRADSDRSGFDDVSDSLEWVEGQLGDASATERLVHECDAVVHGALYRAGLAFRGGEGDPVEFARQNILGSLQLIEAARAADTSRFVFVSTCAVHERILDDRPLDEAHPLWSTSHYGAHKAAIEKFVHSYGLGAGFPICAIRPTGVYGIALPVENSKWFPLVRSVVRGEDVECRGGGKEVHAADVAKAIELLLTAEGVTGEAFSCYDRYVSEFDIATTARRLSGSDCEIVGEPKQPKHEIVTEKIKRMGMQFGGSDLLERTIGQLVDAARSTLS